MLRISQYIKDSLDKKEIRSFGGVILIWNLTNVCNLSCRHCYASALAERQEELEFSQIKRLIPELKREKVNFVILSGGEPLIRKDIFSIAQELRAEGIRTYLSSNGLLINEKNIDKIRENFDYLGISIDGTPEVHDRFRGKKGAYETSMRAIRLGLQSGIRVGMRFTLSSETYSSLPFIFDLAEKEKIPKIYISHLVYAGRGEELLDLNPEQYCKAVDKIMEMAFTYVENDRPIDIVTGNNEADAIVLWQKFQKRYPDSADNLYKRLMAWGGNQAGKRLANIDAKGNLKPDPFFKEIVGNVSERSFTELWNTNGTLSKLREYPRQLGGICGDCPHLKICNGNSRVRSYAEHGSYWESDPACHLAFSS